MNEVKPEIKNIKNTSPENQAKQEKPKDVLKLLQNSRVLLSETFKKSKEANHEYTKLADIARDEMLRVEGAIQQVDVFIKQLKGEI